MKNKKSMLCTGFIDVNLWNEAKWRATVIMSDKKSSPYLGLAFENKKAAIKIFEKWIQMLGHKDVYDELRISIIEGEIPGEDSGYTVHINSSMDNIIRRCKANNVEPMNTLVMTVGRYNRMNPQPYSRNIEIFKEEFNRFLSYNIIPVHITKNMELEPLMDLKIEKKELIFRNSKDINEDDIDYVVFNKNKS